MEAENREREREADREAVVEGSGGRGEGKKSRGYLSPPCRWGTVSECLAIDAKSKDSRRYAHIQSVWSWYLISFHYIFCKSMLRSPWVITMPVGWNRVTPQLRSQAQVSEQDVQGTPSPPHAISLPPPTPTAAQAGL